MRYSVATRPSLRALIIEFQLYLHSTQSALPFLHLIFLFGFFFVFALSTVDSISSICPFQMVDNWFQCVADFLVVFPVKVS